MKVEQFEDKELSQFSYAILAEDMGGIILIDPARDIEPYLNFAVNHKARIKAVIETHPHADFVSGHLELHEKTGATIYCSKLLDAAYPHETFDEGKIIHFGSLNIRALNTPGHSPDGICVVLQEAGKDYAVFSGDTLFIGDCGRPDLREFAGNVTVERRELGKQMYHSLRNKLMHLDDHVLVFPGHGAGTLCGKTLSQANSSTIGAEKISNWSLQEMSEQQFLETLLKDQPFIPAYFPYDVELNRIGSESLDEALSKIRIVPAINSNEDLKRIEKSTIIIDSRPSKDFKRSHLSRSFNIMADGKFETWLGTILTPGETFYLAAESEQKLGHLLKRVAKIGYEPFIKEAFVLNYGDISSPEIDLTSFREHPDTYSIIDIRNENEVKDDPIFNSAVNIPLPELRKRIGEIPRERPLVVHCSGGYRSAVASSIIEEELGAAPTVLDLGAAVNEFQ